MEMALQGLRIIDWTQWQAGPAATALLADLGAEVIKVEELGAGDPVRGNTEAAGVSLELAHGLHIAVEEMNRNKKGIAVDLKNSKGRNLIYDLVKRSDVFVTNFRLSTILKLGMDYETLSSHNPKLIYAACSGYGSRGPESSSGAYDWTAQARSGIMMESGEEGSDPVTVTPGVGDRVASLVLAYGIMVGLFARERLGIGQKVETSQLVSLLLLQAQTINPFLLAGRKMPRFCRKKEGNPLWNYYRCKDNRWIMFAMPQSDVYWPAFCRAVAREELRSDPRFNSAASRKEHCVELISILDEVFATKTLSEWQEIFNQSGQLIFSPVQELVDLLHDPQVLANDYIWNVEHPVLGPIKLPAHPVTFSATPATYTRGAPQVGQHTEEVLLDVCGYTWDDITSLKAEGAIA